MKVALAAAALLPVVFVAAVGELAAPSPARIGTDQVDRRCTGYLFSDNIASTSTVEISPTVANGTVTLTTVSTYAEVFPATATFSGQNYTTVSYTNETGTLVTTYTSQDSALGPPLDGSTVFTCTYLP